MFDSLGSGWGNKDALDSPHLQWLSVPMMSGISELLSSLLAIVIAIGLAGFCVGFVGFD